MTNYIVENCPAQFDSHCYGYTNTAVCSDCNNCLIKRIIDRCVEASKKCNCKDVVYDIDCFECTAGGNAKIAREILSMFKNRGV